MERIVHRKNIEESPSLSSYIDKRLKKVEKFFRNDPTATLNFEIAKVTDHHKKGDIYRAEINISSGGSLLRAEARTESPYSAVDEAQADILRQVKKFRKKRLAVFMRGARFFKTVTRLNPLAFIKRRGRR